MSGAMTRLLSLLGIGVGLLVTVEARADNAILGARAELDEEAFVVSLTAERAIGSPRVRSEPGVVRVWLPDTRTEALDVEADGSVIRWVRVRTGFADTAVVVIRLGDQRDLGVRAVDVTHSGSSVVIRIARSALPVGGHPVEAEAPPLAEAPPAPSEPEPQAADERAEEAVPSAEAPRAREAGREPISLALGRPAPETLPSSSGVPTAMLVLITAVLGLGFLAHRVISAKRKAHGPAADIEVIASKRIGARHQLLVVRALGSDHLLSIHGGRTEKLASLAVPEGASAGAAPADFAPFLRVASKRAQETDARSSVDSRSSMDARSGAELLRAAMTQRNDAVELARSAPSEAVAGLLRLRERAGRG